jgi:uncharacterized protein
MAHITVENEDIELDEPIPVEGLPGLGLVGKIAADHLVDTFDMPHYATCYCEGLPEIAVYDSDGVEPPVRLHADEQRDLLVLQSDIPISPSAAKSFAGCVTDWLAEQDALPLFISGTQRDGDETTELFGVATGAADTYLSDLEVGHPEERGVVSGPTGALLYQANMQDLDSLGLIVEASPQFPDPTAAKVLLERVVEPLADVTVDTELLVDRAQEISAAKQRLAQQMEQADDEGSRAEPLGMFQ